MSDTVSAIFCDGKYIHVEEMKQASHAQPCNFTPLVLSNVDDDTDDELPDIFSQRKIITVPTPS